MALSKLTRVIASSVFAFVVVGIALQFGTAVNASPAFAKKISPMVLTELSRTKEVSIVLLLADQADVSLAYSMTDRETRGWYVFNTLTRHANRSQANLRRFNFISKRTKY